MFFFLRNRREADYLPRLMWSKFRLIVLSSLPAAALLAQEQPSPSPAPSASPAAEVKPAQPDVKPGQPEEKAKPTDAAPDGSETAPVEPTPAPDEPASAADAAPSASPEPAPAPAEDVIPLEGQPAPVEGGAPLDTQDIAPALPDAAYTDPNAIIPDEPLAPPALPTAAENLQEKARQISIRYKEVRVQVEKDPQVASLMNQAKAAKTMEDERAALRAYYRLLFQKMVAIDKSLAEKCQVMESAYLYRLSQHRLEPTIPLNPPPTPEPLN